MLTKQDIQALQEATFKVDVDEQETVIQHTRGDKYANITITDNLELTRIRKALHEGDDAEIIRWIYNMESRSLGGVIIHLPYRFVCYRSPRAPMSDEQKKILSERGKKALASIHQQKNAI